MSECIKTGAVIEIAEYGAYAFCDMHAFDDVVICNINPHSVVYSSAQMPWRILYEVSIGNGYYHVDKGVLVTHKTNIKEL